MEKVAVFVVNEKGGTGKSFFARGWLDLARASGRRVAAFDADGKVSSLVKAAGTRKEGRVDREQDPLVGVGYFDMMNRDEQEILVNAIETGGEAILIDTPAGAMDELGEFLGSGEELFDAYRDAGYRPVLTLVIDADDASTQSVSKAVKRYGESVDYVVVRNMRGDRLGLFAQFESAAAGLVRGVGGSIVTMGTLRDQTVGRILASGMQSFEDVLKSPELHLSDRISLRRWLADLERELSTTPLTIGRSPK